MQTGKSLLRLIFCRNAKGIAGSSLQIIGAEPLAKTKVTIENTVETVPGNPYALELLLESPLTDGRRYTVTYTPNDSTSAPTQAQFTVMDLEVTDYRLSSLNALAQ